jgi:phosphohistidine swiveling domain-containing protein
MDKTKKSLTLLGIWNILPVGAWTWFNDIAVAQLKRLTGRDLGIFCYVKSDLNYECFVQKDTDQLKEDLDTLSSQEQRDFVQKITDDYYEKAKLLREGVDRADKLSLSNLTDDQLASAIKTLSEVWSTVTMQIWYAVLLDIWYPSSSDKAILKRIIAPARDHCGHLHERSDKIERQMNAEAARRIGISEREIAFMVQPEIAEALRGNFFSREEIKSRLECCVLSNHSGSFSILGGADAEFATEGFAIPKAGPPRKEPLKGIPASKGKVTGTARVILLDKEFAEFKDGEILISLQTMVHYTPIMKKASAILTEFGGLTSHAAIVSRELGKPAIVGISGLISTIKTGDIIEVDAEKGIVRKIMNQ